MMSMKRVLPLLAAILAVSVFPAFADADNRAVVIPDARALATGGFHAARAEGISSIFDNPASFVAVKPVLEISQIGIAMSGPIFNFADLMVGGASTDLASITGLLDSKLRLYAAVDIPGPISFGYVGNGLGFGVFNDSSIKINVAGMNTADITADEQTLLTGGYAFRVPVGSDQNLDFGIEAKGFIRGEILRETTLIDLVGILQSASASTLTDSPFALTTGIGVDLGMRYSLGKRFAAGLVAHDIYTPTAKKSYATYTSFSKGSSAGSAYAYGLVPMNLEAGVLYSPSLGSLDQYIGSFNLMFDYSDITNTFSPLARNPVLNLGFGVDMTLFDIFSLRGGIYEGLLDAGLALNLTYFTLNAAMYGRELGREPGMRPVYDIIIGLEFKL